MGDRDLPQHLGEFSIMSWPEEEMPVIRYQAIGGDSDPGLGVSLGENLLRGGVVSGFLKQGESPALAVEDVVGEISSSKAWTAWYTGVGTEIGTRLSRKDSRPLFLSRTRGEQ
jgi:hypothetical protein